MEPGQREALMDDRPGSFRRYSIRQWQLAFPLMPQRILGFLLMTLPKSGSNYYATLGNLAQTKSFPQKEQRAALRIFNVPLIES